MCDDHCYDSCSQGPMDFDHDRFYVSDWVVLARAGRLVISSSLSSDVVVMTSDIEPNVVSKLFCCLCIDMMGKRRIV